MHVQGGYATNRGDLAVLNECKRILLPKSLGLLVLRVLNLKLLLSLPI